jgi:hypothetical protein
MPVFQTDMAQRSLGTTPAWQANPRRIPDAAEPAGPSSADTRSLDLSRLADQLSEIQRTLNVNARQGSASAPPAPAVPVPLPIHNTPSPVGPVFLPALQANGPPPWGPGLPPPFNTPGPAPVNTFARPGPPPQMPLIPPPPYVDDISRDFSLCSPTEYMVHEARLYQRINFHAKVRLGYGKAISVLQRELEGGRDYQPLIRPYQIDQPEDLPYLSPLIPNSEARLFADTVRALVDIIGLQRACQVLEAAKVNEIPGIRYEIQRVPIPPKPQPGPLQPVPFIPPVPSEVGPFARPRSDSVNSGASTLPPWIATTFPWGSVPAHSNPNAFPFTVQDGQHFSSPPLTPTQPRSILRQNPNGASFNNGKRVTIQTDCPECRCIYPSHGQLTPPMSAVPMSPMKLHEELSMSIQKQPEHIPFPLSVNIPLSQPGPPPINQFKADGEVMILPMEHNKMVEDVILQQMAAAQM